MGVMSDVPGLEISSLRLRVRAGSKDRTYWDAQWRWRLDPAAPWQFRKCRLGLAWQESDGAGGWRKRSGRCREGWLDERAANVAAVVAVEDFRRELADEQYAEREALERKATVRVLAR